VGKVLSARVLGWVVTERVPARALIVNLYVIGHDVLHIAG
jgi:hypothetical protein